MSSLVVAVTQSQIALRRRAGRGEGIGMAERNEDDVELRHRTTKDDARRLAEAGPGLELPAPDHEDESGVTDLGVREPQAPGDLDSTSASS